MLFDLYKFNMLNYTYVKHSIHSDVSVGGVSSFICIDSGCFYIIGKH